MKRVFYLLALVLTWTVAAVSMTSCAGGEFDPASLVNSVRVLAVRADHPYASPGETVELEMLAVDGRKAQPRPLRTFWLPVVCENPRDDLYYACFQTLLAGAGAAPGAGDGGVSSLVGKDISAILVEGTKFSFRVRDDLITSHPVVAGAPKPYGLAIAFYIACAGHPEIVAPDPNSLQKPPLACFDEQGTRLGTEDYVIGFSRVYAYDGDRNENPTFGAIRFEGQEVDPKVGITVGPCTEEKITDCAKKQMIVEAPETSQETSTFDLDVGGKPLREQVWVSFYTTVGRFDSAQKLLYDATSGRVTQKPENAVFGPNKPELPRDGRVYLIVRDSRGGASWTDFPIVTR